MRIEPISLFEASDICMPKIKKSSEVISREMAISEAKISAEKFIEREENFKKHLPHFLGKNVNFLA